MSVGPAFEPYAISVGVTPGALAKNAGFATRLWQALAAAWGCFTGILPHVLHHVGPLAGAAVLAGAGGRVLFFLLGLVAFVPMLRRIYRRFRSWVAPAVAVAVFVLMFSLSSFVIGPLITGDNELVAPPPPTTQTSVDPHGH